ncbi:hypothetical protein GGS23DRAFT_595086 [Durotheca rogersii]|uniref:uncharacterized protein n=1 Tax=Durotheca rogersii TaxID=419775 RepID=UPI00221E4C3F|nr:uncharacterized protein GGS23DRAFT_595086 [Durotheca rogersii]KAI5865569.1 hypothetical protein GGS23DRAFT_595086 [Durotheca rogersii]
MDASQVIEAPYPARLKHDTGPIDGVPTKAGATFFFDKIIVTLSQEGRLSQWIQVPLSAPSSASVDMALVNDSLLPMSHLTPKTLLGGGGEEREALGQLYAVQIASFILRKNPDERRTLVVSLGFPTLKRDREVFFDLLELVQKVL